MKYLIQTLIVIIIMLFSLTISFAEEINITDDITIPTNLPLEVVENILPDTLKDYAQNFIDGEQEYEINMLFVMSIAKQETSNGTAGVGKSKNNLFGVRSGNGYQSFESFGKSIDNEFRLLKEVYIDKGKTDISSVARTYCSPPEHWTSAVNSIFNEYIETALSQYETYKNLMAAPF